MATTVHVMVIPSGRERIKSKTNKIRETPRIKLSSIEQELELPYKLGEGKLLVSAFVSSTSDKQTADSVLQYAGCYTITRRPNHEHKPIKETRRVTSQVLNNSVI